MKVYARKFAVELKEDNSPLTEADHGWAKKVMRYQMNVTY